MPFQSGWSYYKLIRVLAGFDNRIYPATLEHLSMEFHTLAQVLPSQHFPSFLISLELTSLEYPLANMLPASLTELKLHNFQSVLNVGDLLLDYVFSRLNITGAIL